MNGESLCRCSLNHVISGNPLLKVLSYFGQIHSDVEIPHDQCLHTPRTDLVVPEPESLVVLLGYSTRIGALLVLLVKAWWCCLDILQGLVLSWCCLDSLQGLVVLLGYSTRLGSAAWIFYKVFFKCCLDILQGFLEVAWTFSKNYTRFS